MDRKQFSNEAFRKRWRHDNHVVTLTEFSSNTLQIKNARWLLRIWIPPAYYERKTFDEFSEWKPAPFSYSSGVVCMGHKDRLFHSILVFIRGRKDEWLFILKLMTSRLFYEPFKVSRLSLFRAETASRRWVILVTDITWRNESSDVTLAIMRRSSIGITFFFSWNKIQKPLTIWKTDDYIRSQYAVLPFQKVKQLS